MGERFKNDQFFHVLDQLFGHFLQEQIFQIFITQSQAETLTPELNNDLFCNAFIMCLN